MTATQIVQADAWRLRVPLASTYRLSFVSLTAFDTIIVRVVDSDGRTGIGESCPLPGYSREDADAVWRTTVTAAMRLVGLTQPEAADFVRCFDSGGPFGRVAAATAVEGLASYRRAVSIPLVGTVYSRNGMSLQDEVNDLARAGYKTLKFKIGFDPYKDAERVAALQQALRPGMAIRLDANQGYDMTAAHQFLSRLEPAGIELLEQPFPTLRWDWTEALVRSSPPVSIMLDESIETPADVRRAAELGVPIVKFKLMKAGSMNALTELCEEASRARLRVVIGNGVAGAIDNLAEARLYQDQQPAAGEMNGWLKPTVQVCHGGPRFESGHLVADEGDYPELDVHIAAEFITDRIDYPNQR